MLAKRCLREGCGGRRNHPVLRTPPNVRRGKGGTAFGDERSEVPKGLLNNLPREVQHVVRGARP